MFASIGPKTGQFSEGIGLVSFLHRNELASILEQGRINRRKESEMRVSKEERIFVGELRRT